MASVVASSRTVSATVFLALIVTGWCLASAVPVAAANARRLQQLSGTGGGLASQLQALTSSFQKIAYELQTLLAKVFLPADLLAQLQKVAASFVQAQTQLQTDVSSLLLALPGQPEIVPVLQDLLKNQLATKLQTLLTLYQNAQPVGGCFKELQASSLSALSELTDKLKSTSAALPVYLQPVAFIADLQNLATAASLVDACSPGLQSLLSNDQAVLAAVTELIAGLQKA